MATKDETRTKRSGRLSTFLLSANPRARPLVRKFLFPPSAACPLAWHTCWFPPFYYDSKSSARHWPSVILLNVKYNKEEEWTVQRLYGKWSHGARSALDVLLLSWSNWYRRPGGKRGIAATCYLTFGSKARSVNTFSRSEFITVHC